MYEGNQELLAPVNFDSANECDTINEIVELISIFGKGYCLISFFQLAAYE